MLGEIPRPDGTHVPEKPRERYLLELKNFGVRYAEPKSGLRSLNPFRKQDNWVLRNLNFGVKPNTYTAVVGESGSGKTTLLRALSSTRRQDIIIAGEVHCNGQIDLLPSVFERSKEDPELKELNLGVSMGEGQSRVMYGLDLMKSSMVLADEPLRGMDFRFRKRVIDALRDFKTYRGGAMMYATQTLPLELLEITDNVLVLGENPSFGPLDEMRQDEFVTALIKMSDSAIKLAPKTP